VRALEKIGAVFALRARSAVAGNGPDYGIETRNFVYGWNIYSVIWFKA